MRRWVRWVIVALLGFCVGAAADGWLTARLARKSLRAASGSASARRASPTARSRPDSRPLPPVADTNPSEAPSPGPLGTSGSAAVPPAPPAVAALREHALRVPVDGADVSRWKGSFSEIHSGHRHEAVDILAPRGTPVHAVEAGTIGKLFTSKDGGLTIYQFDPTREFVYYYAHLDGYAPGLREGQAVQAGDVLGYVGTTGNAPPNTPHLHFSISQLAPGEGWWQGTPIDPYLVFR